MDKSPGTHDARLAALFDNIGALHDEVTHYLEHATMQAGEARQSRAQLVRYLYTIAESIEHCSQIHTETQFLVARSQALIAQSQRLITTRQKDIVE